MLFSLFGRIKKMPWKFRAQADWSYILNDGTFLFNEIAFMQRLMAFEAMIAVKKRGASVFIQQARGNGSLSQIDEKRRL